MESVPPIGILSAKSGKIHFTPLAIITAEAVLTQHIALQDRDPQRPESGYVYLATSFNSEFINLRTDLYRISQALSRGVAQIWENADCFCKPKKSGLSESAESLQKHAHGQSYLKQTSELSWDRVKGRSGIAEFQRRLALQFKESESCWES